MDFLVLILHRLAHLPWVAGCDRKLRVPGRDHGPRSYRAEQPHVRASKVGRNTAPLRCDFVWFDLQHTPGKTTPEDRKFDPRHPHWRFLWGLDTASVHSAARKRVGSFSKF